MTLEQKTCLICGDVAVIEVISLRVQKAPLCGVHWVDYCIEDGGITADEVRKFFADGALGDAPEKLPITIERGLGGRKTDDGPGEYRTDERESG